MALIGQDNRSATTVARTECVLLEIERGDFLRLVGHRSELGIKVSFKLSELLVNRLRRSSEDIVRLNTALSIVLMY